MKKLLFGLVATLLLVFNVKSQDINNLNKDQDFKNYLKNELEFIKKSDPKLVKQIQGVKDENDLNKFFTAFNTNKISYSNHLNKQNQILSTISNRYNFKKYNQNQLFEVISVEILEIINSDEATFHPIQLPIPENTTLGTNCRRRYNNTLTSNFATAVVAHMACAAGYLAVVPGLICHAGVALIHSTADDNAYLDYLDCVREG